MRYPFKEIEPSWQKKWADQNLYRSVADPSKPKYYVLDMFPYPSGDGLHIGHPEGYTATDIVSRYKRMCRYSVLHPIGFDAFGLPTERQAMVENIHPRSITERNIATFTRQLKSFGFDYDWSRSVNTTDPSYLRWTQWMFLQIYNSWYDPEMDKARHIDTLPIPKSIVSQHEIDEYIDSHRLAYLDHIPVNWCEQLGTVLANEEVDEWIEKGYTVERRPMRQWMLRITAYAERLLTDLNGLDWPAMTIEMQRNWIGKSDGSEIQFRVVSEYEEHEDMAASPRTHEQTITIFTTRPDTIFGATYLVLAPENELVDVITTPEYHDRVEIYRQVTTKKSDLERTELTKQKTGVFTGAFAINPATNERIPIWIADYVLAHYGTGAIMAVPGHDQRDFEFASTFSLSIVTVVAPFTEILEGSPDGRTAATAAFQPPTKAFVDDGINVNSANNMVSLNGLHTIDSKRVISEWLEERGFGRRAIQYKLRDWLFSRQRYWGEPIPIMFFDDGSKRALDDDELPLLLPDVADFKPAGTGESALATVTEWVDFIDKKTGKHARLETNTMPQWAGSCWYYLRYCDPQNNNEFCSKEAEQYWMGDSGIDLYIGGAEHAVLHLIYARFWHKVLFDRGYVSTSEPVRRLFHQGLILAEGKKMSKSLGNVINPDDMIDTFGADAIRLYEMFLGPLEASKPWSTQGIEGMPRFLDRVWRLVLESPLDDVECPRELDRVLHETISKTRADIESLSMNTAIAQFMIFVNVFTSSDIRPRKAIEQFLQCLAPFAPHITEELWMRLGHSTSIHLSAFPEADPTKLIKDEVQIVLQVNSKIRGKVMLSPDADEQTMEHAAMKDEGVMRHLDGKTIRKTIVVRGKLVNFIAS
ncbi:MAG: leucine--tRNA ligase [Ignavibacteria bacterium]|nr:leucine--tRNA ligase [Ignavibacteria bacterium]